MSSSHKSYASIVSAKARAKSPVAVRAKSPVAVRTKSPESENIRRIKQTADMLEDTENITSYAVLHFQENDIELHTLIFSQKCLKYCDDDYIEFAT